VARQPATAQWLLGEQREHVNQRDTGSRVAWRDPPQEIDREGPRGIGLCSNMPNRRQPVTVSRLV